MSAAETVQAEGYAKPEAILAWADKAKPGERMVYFTGFLARSPGAGEIAKAVMDLRAAGKLVRYQKRVRPECFDYIAQRTRAD